MSNHDMPNLNDHTNSIQKKKLKKKKLSESYNKIYLLKIYLLEMQALRNGFGKMVKSNYQTSPQYSFTKSRKLIYDKPSENPGPEQYRPLESFLSTVCRNKEFICFGTAYRFKSFPYNKQPYYFKNIGPGSYNLDYKKIDGCKGFKFGREKRLKDDDPDDYLFIPYNYK